MTQKKEESRPTTCRGRNPELALTLVEAHRFVLETLSPCQSSPRDRRVTDRHEYLCGPQIRGAHRRRRRDDYHTTIPTMSAAKRPSDWVRLPTWWNSRLHVGRLAGSRHPDLARTGGRLRRPARDRRRPRGSAARGGERAAQRRVPFLHQPCQDAYEATASTLTGIFADRPGTTVLRRLTAQGRDESDVHEQGSPRPALTARQRSATRLSPPRSVNDSRA